MPTDRSKTPGMGRQPAPPAASTTRAEPEPQGERLSVQERERDARVQLLERQLAEARNEIAALRGVAANGGPGETAIERLTRERDDARAGRDAAVRTIETERREHRQVTDDLRRRLQAAERERTDAFASVSRARAGLLAQQRPAAEEQPPEPATPSPRGPANPRPPRPAEP